MSPELAVVLHGVQPATWKACLRVIDAIGDVAAVPMTLALVPAATAGSGGDGEGDDAFDDAMQERLECGDELAVHGDTAKSGEDEAAMARLTVAMRWFATRRWPLLGLVERQWLSPLFRRALCSTPLRYAIAPQGLYALPQGKLLQSRSLAYSAEGMWERLSCLGRNAMADRTAPESEPLLRFELHPGDADDALLRRDWQRRLAWHLQYRRAGTMADVIQRWPCEAAPA